MIVRNILAAEGLSVLFFLSKIFVRFPIKLIYELCIMAGSQRVYLLWRDSSYVCPSKPYEKKIIQGMPAKALI